MLKAFHLRIAKDTLQQEISLALILKFLGQSAIQILKKLDRQFSHGAGRLDRHRLEDEPLVLHNVLVVLLYLCGVGDGPSDERGSDQIRRSIVVDARYVSDETAAASVWVHCYSIWPLSVIAVKTRRFEHGQYPGCRKAA